MQQDAHRSFLLMWWKSIDQQTIIALGLLFAFSLMLVTTASPAVAHRIGLEETYFSTRHVLYLLLGAVIMFGISLLDQFAIRKFTIIGFVLTMVILNYGQILWI
jgi:cell division protein FtsW